MDYYDLLGSLKDMKPEELSVFFAINDMRANVGNPGLALDTRLSKTIRERNEVAMEEAYVFDSHESFTSGGIGATPEALLRFAEETKELKILPVNRKFDTHLTIAFDGNEGWVVHSMHTYERMPVLDIKSRDEAEKLMEQIAPTDLAVSRSLFRKDAVFVSEKAGITIGGTVSGPTVPYWLEKKFTAKAVPIAVNPSRCWTSTWFPA